MTPTTTTTSEALAARLRLAVTRLARRLRQQSAEGLSPSQTAALSTIERHGPLSPSELASIERIQRPTATRVLGALIERGLVARAADPADGRSSRVSVTGAGAALLRRGRSRKDAYLHMRLRRLAPADIEALARAVQVIERLLQDEEPDR